MSSEASSSVDGAASGSPEAAGTRAPEPTRRLTGLRLELGGSPYAIRLDRIEHLVGFCALQGSPDDFFRGWLLFRGRQLPVFDLNRVVCDQPTPEAFGSRILIVRGHDTATELGLLAPGITDTACLRTAGLSDQPDDFLEEFDLDQYLPMLETLIPPPEPIA